MEISLELKLFTQLAVILVQCVMLESYQQQKQYTFHIPSSSLSTGKRRIHVSISLITEQQIRNYTQLLLLVGLFWDLEYFIFRNVWLVYYGKYKIIWWGNSKDIKGNMLWKSWWHQKGWTWTTMWKNKWTETYCSRNYSI